MVRQIKWRLQFKSLNNTGCLVNIYEEGYTGSHADTTKTGADVPFAVETGVKELIGAAVPFEIEEDDDSDLLQFIRYKTAYMRVIETTYGELDSLMPTSIRHHFVEAYYGSERVFTGFMQCQQFDNGWVSEPRELEFPLVSPLGLLDAFNFNVPSTHGLVTIGSLMNELMIGLNPSAKDATVSDYSDVIYPSNNGYSPWNNLIHSTVMCPFNDEFKHYDDVSKLYSPKDYKYFIEGLCACFGWIIHDTPSSIIFTQYEFSNNYSRVPVSGLLTLTGWEGVQQLATSFNAYYSNIDNNALQSVVMPLKKLVLELEDAEIREKKLSTDHTKVTSTYWGGGTVSGKVYKYAMLTQIGPDVTGDNIHTYNGNAGLFPLAYGSVDQNALSIDLNENWWIKYSSGWIFGTQLINAKFFGMIPLNSRSECILKISVERGTSMEEMKSSDYSDIRLNLVIKVGSKYYNIAYDTYFDTITFNAIIIDGSTGKVTPNKTLQDNYDYDDVDGIIFSPGSSAFGVNDAIEVALYDNGATGLSDGEYLKFTEISLKNPSTIDEPYDNYYKYINPNITVGENQTGTEEKSITVNFYHYQRGEHTFGNSSKNLYGDHPTFPYMFSRLNVLQQKVRKSATINFNEYVAKWTYWISGWRWRMIAKNFNMRDDEYLITLARSSTIE